LYGLLLLQRGLPALHSSVIGTSAAVGMAKLLRGSGGGSIEGKAERDLLMRMGNPAIRNNWKAQQR
jgi:hypothetical protein